jgi:S1-C subfamily serine protease
VKEPVDVLFRVSEKQDGDAAQVTVRRGGEEKTLPLTFFRMAKPKAHLTGGSGGVAAGGGAQ